MPKLPRGSTPLHAASQYSNFNCVRLLLYKGAETEICDSRGLTPLDAAGEVVNRPDNSYDNGLYHNSFAPEQDESNVADQTLQSKSYIFRPISYFGTNVIAEDEWPSVEPK